MTSAVLCVYYKLPAEQHADWAPRVRLCQARVLAQWPGLVAELLQRPDAKEGMETWMETYRHANGLGPALQDAIQQAAVDAGLPAPRHTECFVALT